MDEIEVLNNEIEQLRVQLAGCGVAAMCNTHESVKKQSIPEGSYGWSASYGDVIEAVKREIVLREELEKLKSGENVIDNFTSWLEIIENAIKLDDKAPNDFEIRFADGNQILNTWFSSEKFMVVYMVSAGLIEYVQYPLSDLSEWLNN
jgi:hypothetical protein